MRSSQTTVWQCPGDHVNDDGLRRLAASRGVALGYHEASGRHVEASIETLRALVAAMGDEEPARDGWPPVVVVRAASPWRFDPQLGARTHVRLETGEEVALPDELPGPLPLGYHALVEPARETPLIVVPPRAYLPPGLAAGGHHEGLALQLYSLHSASSWGIGDLGDLAALVRSALVGGFALLNPLHAAGVRVPQEPSPYFASTRRFRNPLAIAVELVPEVALLTPSERAELERLATAGRALTAGPIVERDRVLPVKRAALEICYAALRRSPVERAELDRYRARTPGLELYACFCALAEQRADDWRSWPAELRTPSSSGVAAAARAVAERIGFHAYLQLCIDRQLAALPRLPLGYVADLAVGAAGSGFDGWALQDELALAVRVGAPPDPLGPLGQDWGLPPAIPHRLVANGFASFAQTLRANMQHAAGLRIDHVMGLHRLFWIPPGATPADGTYVHYPSHDLLGIVALESQRARCLVVGEDLGTVEPSVREALAAHDVLSYRLEWFEARAASDYPRLAMAAVTTHDLPTATGFFSGADLAHLRQIGALGAGVEQAVVAERAAIHGRLVAEGLLDPAEDDPARITEALYAFLARTPCMLRALSLDDALGNELRANVPGTIDEHPNWRVRQPLAIEQFAAQPLFQRALAALRCTRGV